MATAQAANKPLVPKPDFELGGATICHISTLVELGYPLIKAINHKDQS